MIADPPKSLSQNLNAGRCVLFAGAGLSASGGLPTWGSLLKELAKESYDETHDDQVLSELDSLIAEKKFLEVAEFCKDTMGENLFNKVLAQNLHWKGDKVPEPHRLIVQIPFSAIITTNYDKIIENSYAALGRGLPRTLTHSDTLSLGSLLFSGDFFVLKAHGDIDRPENLVFTSRDYQRIIHANPAFNAAFSAILMTKSILFLGYSLSDPDFRLLLDRQLTAFDRNVPERYAVMPKLKKIETDLLWRSARIRVIPYDEHTEVLKFLKKLQEEIVRVGFLAG